MNKISSKPNEEASNYFLVKASEDILKMIELALNQISFTEFCQQVEMKEDELRQILNEKNFIPLRVLALACKINKSDNSLPEKFRFFTEFIKGSKIFTLGETLENHTKRQNNEHIDEAAYHTIRKRKKDENVSEGVGKAFAYGSVGFTLALSILGSWYVGSLVYGEVGGLYGLIFGLILVHVELYSIYRSIARKEKSDFEKSE